MAPRHFVSLPASSPQSRLSQPSHPWRSHYRSDAIIGRGAAGLAARSAEPHAIVFLDDLAQAYGLSTERVGELCRVGMPF